MATTAVVTSLTVPSLTDNTIAFANAAAWNQYWAGAGFSVNIPIATDVLYGVVKAATTLTYTTNPLPPETYITLQLDINGSGTLVPYTLPLTAYIDAIVTKLNNLETDYIALKAGLKAASLISNA